MDAQGSPSHSPALFVQKSKHGNQGRVLRLPAQGVRFPKVQEQKILDKSVKWIKDFNNIKNGPVIFFGNEFLDAIPIKQFRKENGSFFEKNYMLNKNFDIEETYRKASKINSKMLKSYLSIKDLNFIEFPKLGFQNLKKITKKILKLEGCILLIDYGYLKPHNENTLQSVLKHKKNKLLDNLGKADVTSHINFELLKEFFKKNNCIKICSCCNLLFIISLIIITNIQFIFCDNNIPSFYMNIIFKSDDLFFINHI